MKIQAIGGGECKAIFIGRYRVFRTEDVFFLILALVRGKFSFYLIFSSEVLGMGSWLDTSPLNRPQ